MTDSILYDFSFDGFKKKALQAYTDAQPRFCWLGREAKKSAKQQRHYPYESGGYYIKYCRWIERGGWHFFVNKIAFHKGNIEGDVPIIMRFVSDTDRNGYAMMIRLTENKKDMEVFALSLHFLRRYSERQLCDREADLAFVARVIARQFVDSLRYITTGTTYGTNNSRICLVLGIGEGLAFGYKDMVAGIQVVDTYVHQTMLRNNQHHVFDYLHSDAEDGDSSLCPLVIGSGKLRPMNEDELVDYIEHRKEPEYQEKIRVQKMWEMQQNRRRWENKSKRSADSVQVKRPQIHIPKLRPSSYNPFDE